jgi:hypothetical protein
MSKKKKKLRLRFGDLPRDCCYEIFIFIDLDKTMLNIMLSCKRYHYLINSINLIVGFLKKNCAICPENGFIEKQKKDLKIFERDF